MLKPAPPLTSTQRVQQFRERNPGYDRRWKARRSESLARLAALQAQTVAPAEKQVLMLPAPVACPLTAEINALKAKLAALEVLPVSAATIPPAAKSIAA